MPLYKKEDILAATNDGLDIICHYYPEAREAAGKKGGYFSMHTEKTASSTIRKENGIWRVCDFGDDRKEMDAFALAMKKETECGNFGQLLQLLGKRHNISGTDGSKPSGFKYEKRDATAEEPDGEYYWKVREEFQEFELKTLGRFVNENHCKALNCYALEEYTYIKDRKAHIFVSTESYPQFLFDWGEFKKLYKPKEKDKKHRFIYIGKKPKDFIYGMENVKRMCKDYQIAQERKQVRGVADDKLLSGDDDDDEENEQDAAALLPEVVLASGERDALNALSAGYPPVWKNSETAQLLGPQYAEIKKYCKRIVNIPDIDETGIKKARELGLKYLELATAWLPKELKAFTDFRGNPCKDLTDYLWHFTSWNLERIVSAAVCFKPWEEVKTKKGFDYVINNAQAYEFMYANGFHRIEKKNEKSGFIFIKVRDNVVHEIKPVEIKTFMHEWLKSNGYTSKLRNVFYRTTQLNETGLNGNLDVAELDFTDHDKHHQLFYFNNEIVKVAADGYAPTTSRSNYVWKDEILGHDFKKLEPFFTWHIEGGKVILDSIDESFSMVKFIMNTSRVFWRKELDKTITDAQIEIHKQHFLNKCFILGYVMFRFKNPSAPWAPFAVDSRDGSLGEANGGSGKSIFLQIPTHYMTSVVLNGRDEELTKNKHIFEQVTDKTDFVLVDDCTGNVDFHFFFNFLTGNFQVNPKNIQSFSIPFNSSPKIAFSSNHMLKKIDPSTDRRLIYGVFSDYYHKKDNKIYKSDCIPSAEFGKNLIIDYTPDEMNQLSNFLMQCVQLFMVLMSAKSPIKLDPPMDNVERRILRQQIGENFLDWASTYFSIPDEPYDMSGHVDVEMKRKEMYDAYKEEYSDKYTTPKNFKDKLNAFCLYKGWVLNEEDRCTDRENNRIIRKIDGKAIEVFYINTKRNIASIAAETTDEDLNVKDLSLFDK